MDPYKVLGILPHASPDEVKTAYTKLIENYNTYDGEDDSVKNLYSEKLIEANEAYRIIKHNMTCEEVRDLIESDDFIAAEAKLNLVSDLNSAEWNYLQGILLLKKGWIDSGVNHIKQATTLNPYNNEYSNTLKQLNQKVGNLKSSYNSLNHKQGNGANLCNGNNSNSNKGGLC